MIKKLLKRYGSRLLRQCRKSEFWFCLLAYPALFFISRLELASLRDLAAVYPVYYGFGMFGLCAIVVICTGLEVVSRLYKHQLQGGKLKMRADEGVQIEDLDI